MAITNAQQAKQILMEDGGIPQLVKKGKGKKRPGYRGDAAARSSGAAASGRVGGSDVGESSTRSDPRDPGPDDRGTTQQNLNQQRIRNEAIARRVKEEFERRERERKAKEAIDAQAKKVMDRRKKMGMKSLIDLYDLPADYDEEKDDVQSGAMLDLFINDPMRTDKPEKFMPLSVKLLEGPLKKGAVKTRSFFADPNYKSIFGRPKKSVLEAGRYQYKGAPLTQERFSKMSLTEQNKAYKDYMSDRLSGKTDAYGNVAPGYMRDGSGNIISTGNDRDFQQPIIPPIAQQPKDDDTEEEEDFQMALAFRADGGRVPYADGGIMDLEEAQRQLYFIGGIVKKAKRAVKKIVKSPVGKIGLGALLMGGAGGFSGLLSKAGGLGGMFSKGLAFAKANPLATSLAGGALAGLLQRGEVEDEDGDGFDDKTGLDISKIREDYISNRSRAFRKEGGMSDVENDPQYKGWKRVYEVNPEAAEMHPKHKEFVKYYANVERQGKEEGGLMDLKGMEMDFRDEGGFVPIGKKERADDVPARLSKNEFVMTADAVRGAGNGNIDKGAEKMYNLMSKLEAENDQSQGLDGARKMFKTAQRLEEVL